MLNAVKFAQGVDDVVEGLGIPYRGPMAGGKDLDRQFFSKNTDLALQFFGPGERPLLYEHGLDEEATLSVVGRVSEYKSTDLGLWTQAQLDKSSQYFDAIQKLVKAGKLFFSSGSMEHLAKVDRKSGEITAWPFIELSLTTHPSNLFATATMAETEEHFKSAGIKSAKLDEIKAELEEDALKAALDADARNALDDSDFAYIDSDGGRHLPIENAAHVRAALSRFDQTHFASDADKTAARKKVQAAARKFGIDTADSAGKSADLSYEALADNIRQALDSQTGGNSYVTATYAKSALVSVTTDDEGTKHLCVAYAVDDAGALTLGEMEPAEPAGQPLAMLQTDEAPLAIQSARLSDYAALVTERTKGVSDRRIKEGRVLSTSNRDRLAATADSLEGALKALRDLLDTTDSTAKAAVVDRVATRLKDVELLQLWATVGLD